MSKKICERLSIITWKLSRNNKLARKGRVKVWFLWLHLLQVKRSLIRRQSCACRAVEPWPALYDNRHKWQAPEFFMILFLCREREQTGTHTGDTGGELSEDQRSLKCQKNCEKITTYKSSWIGVNRPFNVCHNLPFVVTSTTSDSQEW